MLSKLLEQLLNDFVELRNILQIEDGQNWLSSINLIINEISEAIKDDNLAIDYIKSARDTYSFINKGNGSFSDFCIWREDFTQRKHLNKKFDDLKQKIYCDFQRILNLQN